MRFNITLPTDVGQRIKNQPNRSGLIAQSLREKFARDEKEELNAILTKAYQDASKEDQQVARDWDTASGDGLLDSPNERLTSFSAVNVVETTPPPDKTTHSSPLDKPEGSEILGKSSL